MSKQQADDSKKKKNPALQLIAGGTAGFVESTVCHPLDTIKTRMQLRRQQNTLSAVRARSSLMEPGMRLMHSMAEPKLNELRTTQTTATPMATPSRAPQSVTASLGPFGTAKRIVQKEGFFSLYKGLTAVYFGIIPKMAIRFLTFEQYREVLQKIAGPPTDGAEYSVSVNFTAGLACGLTEAVAIVTPAEVCKIRMQSQYNSLIDPSQLNRRKYKNVIQTALTITREEGFSALYKGIVPTALRQACNQAVNFTTYNIFKRKVLEMQNKKELDHWQSLVLGGISGGFGPLANNPLDVCKTRLQKQVIKPGVKPKYTGVSQAISVIYKEEGFFALWKGITPRLLRIVPGQAITFMTYEAVSSEFLRRGYFT